MGLFDMLRKGVPGGPRSIAKHLLKYYLTETSKFPYQNKKEIYLQMLEERYSIYKLCSNEEMNTIVDKADSLMELALLVIGHENPVAMSDAYIDGTIKDIAEFYRDNAPKEYDDFVNKATKVNAGNQQDINSGGEANHNNIPSRYTLESRLASLVDSCSLEELKESNACIAMGKDFSFSYVVDLKIFENQFRYDLAKVYLREVPNFEMLIMCREEYQNQRYPGTYFTTDMFAKEAIEILLERSCRINK
jgi:hypothetical protein